MKVVSIHQPEHMPWLGFFDKMSQSNTFVLLDTVQYRKNYFQNRNQIRVNYNAEGWAWLTVPTAKGPFTQLVKDVQISNDKNWRKEHWRLLQLWYGKAPYFHKYKDAFQAVYAKEWTSLSNFNIELIFLIKRLLGIDTELMVASELGMGEPGKGGTEVNFNICARLGATAYLSGKFGKDYLDECPFKEKGIAVKYQDFHHPVYHQMFDPFVPNMSSIDLLFNEGDTALKIMREANGR